MKKKLIILSLILFFVGTISSQEKPNQQNNLPNTKIAEVINTEIVINFDFNDCTIKKTFFESMNKFIKNLSNTEQYNVLITGHTDKVGNNNDNEKLGLCRANAVKKYFIEKGIDTKRISIISKGEKVPIADNNIDDGAYKNRRVVINLIEKK